jgi:HEAT repeat protein
MRWWTARKLKSGDVATRWGAARKLALVGDERAIDSVVEIVCKAQFSVERAGGVNLLLHLGTERAAQSLISAAKTTPEDTRLLIGEALMQRRNPKAVELLWGLVGAGTDLSIRRKAIDLLLGAPDRAAIDALLIGASESRRTDVAELLVEELGSATFGDAATRVLSRLGADAIEPLLRKLNKPPFPLVVHRVMSALGGINDQRAVDSMGAALSSADHVSRAAAALQLARVSKKEEVRAKAVRVLASDVLNRSESVSDEVIQLIKNLDPRLLVDRLGIGAPFPSKPLKEAIFKALKKDGNASCIESLIKFAESQTGSYDAAELYETIVSIVERLRAALSDEDLQRLSRIQSPVGRRAYFTGDGARDTASTEYTVDCSVLRKLAEQELARRRK